MQYMSDFSDQLLHKQYVLDLYGESDLLFEFYVYFVLQIYLQWYNTLLKLFHVLHHKSYVFTYVY